MLALYFKRVRFNVKDAPDFFIAQTVPVEVSVPLKTWLYKPNK
jgi:hypothetical protein